MVLLLIILSEAFLWEFVWKIKKHSSNFLSTEFETVLFVLNHTGNGESRFKSLKLNFLENIILNWNKYKFV